MREKDSFKGPEFAVAVPTLLTPRTIYRYASPIESWVQLANTLGYDGISWRPLSVTIPDIPIKNYVSTPKLSFRAPLSEWQIAAGIVSPRVKNRILAAEQSYVGEKTLRESLTHPNKRLAILSYLMFPYRTDSYKHLHSLQKLRPNIPIVVYPPEDMTHALDVLKEQLYQRQLTHKLVQLGPHLVKAWGVPASFDHLVQTVLENGYRISADVAHLSRLAEHIHLPEPEEIARMVFPYTDELQLALGRTDMRPGDTQTVDARDEFASGSFAKPGAQTFESRFTRALLERGYQGVITTEIYQGDFSGRETQLADLHKQILTNLRMFLSRL